jgi:phosphoribosylformimino-5-aminoimidazole carboxamide ribotide isomerase
VLAVFEVIPAIDVSHGRLARYEAGGAKPVDLFDGDPVAAAGACVAAGASRLHVVDMDLASVGEARNLHVVEAIVGLGVPVQAAGGITTSAEVRTFLDAGVSRVVLGSRALADMGTAAALLADEGSRLVVGLEVDDDRIRSRGRDPVELELMDTVGWVVAAGARTLLVTSVARVAGLGGPDVGLVRRVSGAGRPVLGAGGVSTVGDLHDLRAAGAAGAVVGRAVLDGSLDLSAAIAEMA